MTAVVEIDAAGSRSADGAGVHPGPRRGRRWAGIIILLVAVVAVTVILTGIGVRWAHQVAATDFEDRLKFAARDLAAGFPIEVVESLFMGGGEASATPAGVQQLLERWRAFLPARYEVALLAWRGGGLRIGAASDGPAVSKLAGRLGAQRSASEISSCLMDGGVARWLNERGERWVCAAAPIRDLATGSPIAAAAVAGPEPAQRHLFHHLANQVVAMALLIVVAVGVGGSVLLWRERQPYPVRVRWRHTETVLTAIIGLLAMGAVTRVVEVARERDLRMRFRHAAEGLAGAVRMALREMATHQASIVRFFDSSEIVTEPEFDRFAAPLLRRALFDALIWAPRVTREGAEGPEAAGWTRAGRRALAYEENEPMGEAAVMAPVMYAVPSEARSIWRDRDLFSASVISSALHRAAADLATVVTDEVSAPAGAKETRGRCLVTAVYRSRPSVVGPDGWVVGFVNPQRVADAIVGRIAGLEPSLRIEVVELGVLWRLPVEAALHYPMLWAGRPWALVCHPPADPSEPTVWPFMPLRAWGLATVVTLTALVGLMCSREVRLEREVVWRTRELAESEEDLRVTLHSIHDGVLATDAEGRVTLMNPEAERLTGWTSAEAVGQPSHEVFRIVSGATGEPAPDPVRQVLDTGLAVGLANDTLLIARDGRRTQIADSAAPIRLSDRPQPAGVVLVFRDVSEEYAARQALAESERRYRLLFERMDDGFALHEVIRDEQGRPCDYRFLEVNPAFERQTGLRANDLLGRTLREALPGTAPEWVERYARVVETDQPDEFEHYHAPTGRYYHVTAFRTDRDRFATLFLDITDRQRAFDELRRQRQVLNDIIETVQDGISVLDLDFKIRFTNSTMRRWYAANLPLEGRTCHEVYHNQTEPCANCPTLRCLASGRRELSIVPGLPGSPVEWVEVYAYPMHDPVTGQITGVVEFVRDITAQRRAEEEQQRMQARMTEVQRLESLGVLAGGIAHDFNNILMAILGNAELASQDLPPHSPARVNLSEIAISARRAAELCRQMLAYAGRGRFIVETFDLNRLVGEMLGLLKTSISKRAVLNVHLEPNIPPISADPSQIRQVVMNLIINASEAIGDRSGTITVRTGVMNCDRRYLVQAAFENDLPEGLYVVLEVADTGCGMDHATLSRIFEPFFTTKFTGRGLGLSAVLGILRAHKGGIKVYSEPGKGSLFKVLLPASTAPIQSESPPALEIVGWEGGRVLFVDDEESVRTLGARMLERMGFEVTVAADGREALEIFAQRPGEWSLVVLDLTMPQMGGEEAYRRLRELRADIPVVLASGYSSEELGARFASKGFAGFLQKPFTMVELQRAVVLALRKNRSDGDA